jgi:hypothetical protein
MNGYSNNLLNGCLLNSFKTRIGNLSAISDWQTIKVLVNKVGLSCCMRIVPVKRFYFLI